MSNFNQYTSGEIAEVSESDDNDGEFGHYFD